eukprot:15355081-Ditylum_brightwellii.AAC.1
MYAVLPDQILHNRSHKEYFVGYDTQRLNHRFKAIKDGLDVTLKKILFFDQPAQEESDSESSMQGPGATNLSHLSVNFPDSDEAEKN